MTSGESGVRSNLHALRIARGVSAAELAAVADVTRQSIHAIENGSYVPNTAIALRLARFLDTSVEKLFDLEGEQPPEKIETADALFAEPAVAGQPVLLADVGGKRVAVPSPAAPWRLPDADGIVTGAVRGKTRLTPVPRSFDGRARLVVAGCDPAIGLAGDLAGSRAGVDVLAAAASSRLALRWLQEGKVHIAGLHLRDPASGEFNLPILKRLHPKEDFAVVTFAHWAEGFVCGRGNPKRIRTVSDLANRRVRFRNREPGSGSRALVERLLAAAGIPSRRVRGFETQARGHLAAAYAVATGECDVCLANPAAALAFGLDFIPIERERYDFVLKRKTLALPAVKSFLDVLQLGTLRRKLELQAGYETSGTGSVLA